MKESTRSTLYWLAIGLLFANHAFRILTRTVGPIADGGGYEPGLIISGFAPPLVSINEYVNNWTTRLHYSLACLVWAALVTGAGCFIPGGIIQHSPKLRRHPFWTGTALGLVFILLVPTVSDVASRLGILWLPRWFAFQFVDFPRIVAFGVIPLSIGSGIAIWLSVQFLPMKPPRTSTT